MPKKYIPFELDKTRNLRFGMAALIKIEEKLGKPFSQIDFEKNITYKDLSVIIWAGLSHEDSSLTPSKVAELIDDHSDISTAMLKMGEAMGEAFGKNEIVEEKGDGSGTGGNGSPDTGWDWDVAQKTAVQCGISIQDFWEYTPAELNLTIEAYSENKKNEYKNNITYAFYNAYFNLKGQKGLKSKDLTDVIKNLDKKEMTDEEMFEIAKMLAE